MAVLRDEEEQKGQGTSQVLGQTVPGQMQPQEQTEPQQAPSQPATIGASSATQTSAPVKAMPKPQKVGTGTFANLKTYLQAAQGGGQQKIAQAAAGQVQRLGTGAQKGVQQAQQSFGRQMQAGSLAGMETAGQEAADIVKAARGITYQAPPKAEAQPEAPTEESQALTQAQAPITAQPTQSQAQPQQYFTPEQTQRFAEIINAAYQGPASLQQAGVYEQAARKARTAQEAAELAQTAGGRAQLLRDVFGRTREYGRGASRLDALLLNASEQGVQQLQQQAQPALKSQEILQAAENQATNEAAQRKAAIEQIRSGAREAFTGARTEEEQAVEKRIDDLIKTPALDAQGNKIPLLDSAGKQVVDAGGNPVFQTEWDRLPEYFRQSLANKGQSNVKIQQEQIKALNENYNAQLKQIDQLNAQKNELNQRIRDIKSSRNYRKGIYSPASGYRVFVNPEMEKQVDDLTGQVNSLDAQINQAISSPEYQSYQQQLRQAQAMNMNQWVLSPEEAAILGVRAGEGLYNIRPEDIRTAQAERARLITKDELSRQLALAQLAEQDVARQLQKDLLYTDLEKAGTQDLRSSLDTESFRRLLDETEQQFRKQAESANIIGEGSKKHKSTGKRYYAQETANIADLLKKAGYDFTTDIGATARGKVETDKDAPEMNRDLLQPNLGAATDPYTSNQSAAAKAAYGLSDFMSSGGMAGIRALTGVDPVGAITGALGLSGPSSRYAKDIAAQGAREDLQRKVNEYLQSAGFQNRANVADTETTRARTAALMDLLRRQG